MRRIAPFLLGMAFGAALLFTALNYHVIRARDGFHLIRKLESTLGETFVDIRAFGPLDWARNASIAGALVKADRHDLLQTAANDALQTGLDRVLSQGL